MGLQSPASSLGSAVMTLEGERGLFSSINNSDLYLLTAELAMVYGQEGIG